MKKILKILLILTGIYFFLLIYTIFSSMTRKEHGKLSPIRQEKYKKARTWFDRIEKEEITLLSHDKKVLYSDYITSKNSTNKGTLVLVHGYHSIPLINFSTMLEYYYNLGFNILAVNQRSHAKSEGYLITFGVKEKEDLLLWIDYLVSKGEDNIIVYGVSMGCATSLLAAEIGYPKEVKAIIADCGYTSASEQMKYIIEKKKKMPSFPFLGPLKLICKYILGFDMDEADVNKNINKIKIPVMFIHGSNDKYVPTCMSKENYMKFKGKKELYITEGTGHALSNIEHEAEYKKRTYHFIRSSLDI